MAKESNLTIVGPVAEAANATRFFYGSDRYQFGDLRVPQGVGPFPIVIVIHGGFWKAKYSLDLMNPLADDLTQYGFASWNIEYRRVSADGVAGNHGSGWPGTLTDVAQAADYIGELASQYNLDLERVFTLGHSAGGHLALWLAARSRLPENSALTTTTTPLPIAFAVSQAGAIDLDLMWQVRQQNSPVANFLGGTPSEVPERYALASPARLLPLSVPQLLVHGQADDIVPIQISQVYLAAAHQAGDTEASLLALPNVDHFDVIDPTTEVWAKTRQALQKMS
jgi:acetyl esterase/lipase